MHTLRKEAGNSAERVGAWKGTLRGGEGTERSNRAAHEPKKEECEAVLLRSGAMERLGETKEDADERDRRLGVVAELREEMLLKKEGGLGKVG